MSHCILPKQLLQQQLEAVAEEKHRIEIRQKQAEQLLTGVFHVGVNVTVLPVPTITSSPSDLPTAWNNQPVSASTQMVADIVDVDPLKRIDPESKANPSIITPPITPLAHTPLKTMGEDGKSSSVQGALMDESLTLSMDVFLDLMQPSPGFMRPAEVNPFLHPPSDTNPYTLPLIYSLFVLFLIHLSPCLQPLPLSRRKHRSVLWQHLLKHQQPSKNLPHHR